LLITETVDYGRNKFSDTGPWDLFVSHTSPLSYCCSLRFKKFGSSNFFINFVNFGAGLGVGRHDEVE
jgi:hypothetical protein